MRINKTSQDKNIWKCKTCQALITAICQQMRPSEAESFKKCVAEVFEYDGHTICARFLRLYRCGIFVDIRGANK